MTKIKSVNGLEYVVQPDASIVGQGGQGTVWYVVRLGCEYAIKEITLRSTKNVKRKMSVYVKRLSIVNSFIQKTLCILSTQKSVRRVIPVKIFYLVM